MLVNKLNCSILVATTGSRSNRKGVEVGLRWVGVLAVVRIQVKLKPLGVVSWVVIVHVAVCFTVTIPQYEPLDLEEIVPSDDRFFIPLLQDTQSMFDVLRQNLSSPGEDSKE